MLYLLSEIRSSSIIVATSFYYLDPIAYVNIRVCVLCVCVCVCVCVQMYSSDLSCNTNVCVHDWKYRLDLEQMQGLCAGVINKNGRKTKAIVVYERELLPFHQVIIKK